MPPSRTAPRAAARHPLTLLLAAAVALTACAYQPASSPSVGSDAATPDPDTTPLPAATPGQADATAAAGLALVRPVDGVEQVFVMEADGSARQVTGLGDSAAPGASHPLWSPDRSMIAFVPPSIGAGLDPQLWLVKANGTRQRPIVDLGESVSWSPDSTRLLFCDSVFTTDNTGEPARLWIVEAHGGDVTMLNERGTGPRWLPDGKSISYHPVEYPDPGDPQGARPRVLVLPLNGGKPRELAQGVGGWWSPDGGAVLMEREANMFLHDPDGSNPRLLVSGGPPAWSPDGDRIAYGDVDGVGTFLVGVVRRDGRILWSDVPGTNPAWSPDGTKLAVEVGFPDTRTQILDAATGAVVWELDGRHPAW